MDSFHKIFSLLLKRNAHNYVHYTGNVLYTEHINLLGTLAIGVLGLLSYFLHS